MARKLYVGGLSFTTTEHQLREAFAKFGAVESATVRRDRYSDRSRGFGFVETISDSEAEEAIRGLNGALLGKSHAFCPKCGAKVEQAMVQQLEHGIEAFNSVPTAIFAFLSHPQDFASTVIYAVSLGGGTDTIASMAGAISGAYLGMEALPCVTRCSSYVSHYQNGCYFPNISAIVFDTARCISLSKPVLRLEAGTAPLTMEDDQEDKGLVHLIE